MYPKIDVAINPIPLVALRHLRLNGGLAACPA
jgi:hypothetical protein